MKELVAVKGPRDSSLVEVTLHIANLVHQYREDRKIFENDLLPHEDRNEAARRMCKAQDLLENWKDVRRDILKKGGDVPRREIRVS